MSDIKEKLSGVFAPMVTPFRDDDVMYDGIAENVRKMNKTGLRGYFVLGTNGEYKSLGTEERYKVLKTVVDNSSSDKTIMAGCGAESTRETVYLAKRAADAGAQMVSILMPHFFAKKIDVRTMADYIIQVAEQCEVPVLIYNNPSVAAGITVTSEVIKRVKDHPNVVGIKDSSKDTWEQNLAESDEGFFTLAGSANYFFPLLKNGGIGGVLSLANVFPEACSDFYNAFSAGDLERAEQLNGSLVDLNKKISGSFGVAGVKAAMDIAGFVGGTPRRPLKPLNPDQIKDITETLKEYSSSNREGR